MLIKSGWTSHQSYLVHYESTLCVVFCLFRYPWPVLPVLYITSEACRLMVCSLPPQFYEREKPHGHQVGTSATVTDGACKSKHKKSGVALACDFALTDVIYLIAILTGRLRHSVPRSAKGGPSPRSHQSHWSQSYKAAATYRSSQQCAQWGKGNPCMIRNEVRSIFSSAMSMGHWRIVKDSK